MWWKRQLWPRRKNNGKGRLLSWRLIGRKLIIFNGSDSAASDSSLTVTSGSGNLDSVVMVVVSVSGSVSHSTEIAGTHSTTVAGSESGFSLGKRIMVLVIDSCKGFATSSFCRSNGVRAWQRANRKKITVAVTASLAIVGGNERC